MTRPIIRRRKRLCRWLRAPVVFVEYVRIFKDRQKWVAAMRLAWRFTRITF